MTAQAGGKKGPEDNALRALFSQAGWKPAVPGRPFPREIHPPGQSPLYKIERDIAGLTPELRHQRRRRDSRPILDSLKAFVDLWLSTCRPGEPLAKACVYARNQWEALCRFIDDGRAPIDNNPAENALRPIAIGRKNWLFAGSESGGQAAAIAYSLIHAARIHRIDPADYLRRTIRRLHDGTRPELLTPAMLTAANTAASQAARG